MSVPGLNFSVWRSSQELWLALEWSLWSRCCGGYATHRPARTFQHIFASVHDRSPILPQAADDGRDGGAVHREDARPARPRDPICMETGSPRVESACQMSNCECRMSNEKPELLTRHSILGTRH